jgi:hypothetical protein
MRWGVRLGSGFRQCWIRPLTSDFRHFQSRCLICQESADPGFDNIRFRLPVLIGHRDSGRPHHPKKGKAPLRTHAKPKSAPAKLQLRVSRIPRAFQVRVRRARGMVFLFSSRPLAQESRREGDRMPALMACPSVALTVQVDKSVSFSTTVEEFQSS